MTTNLLLCDPLYEPYESEEFRRRNKDEQKINWKVMESLYLFFPQFLVLITSHINIEYIRKKFQTNMNNEDIFGVGIIEYV